MFSSRMLFTLQSFLAKKNKVAFEEVHGGQITQKMMGTEWGTELGAEWEAAVIGTHWP